MNFHTTRLFLDQAIEYCCIVFDSNATSLAVTAWPLNESIPNENAICIAMKGQYIGYVNRGLIPTFLDWMNDKRIKNAWIDKINA